MDWKHLLHALPQVVGSRFAKVTKVALATFKEVFNITTGSFVFSALELFFAPIVRQ